MNFSGYIKQRRIELGYTLRQFATDKGYDVAYLSRLENGILSAPSDKSKVEALARALDLKPQSIAWVELFDLAAASRHEIPEDLRDNPIIPRLLPAFYRTIRNNSLSDEEIEQLKALIEGEQTIGATTQLKKADSSSPSKQ